MPSSLMAMPRPSPVRSGWMISAPFEKRTFAESVVASPARLPRRSRSGISSAISKRASRSPWGLAWAVRRATGSPSVRAYELGSLRSYESRAIEYSIGLKGKW